MHQVDGLVPDCSNSIANAMELLQTCTEPDGLVQDCSNAIANALELLQSCTEPSKYLTHCGLVIPQGITVIIIDSGDGLLPTQHQTSVTTYWPIINDIVSTHKNRSD